MMEWLFLFFIIGVLGAILVAVVAEARGRSLLGWGLLSLFITPILTLLTVLVLPNLKKEQRESAENLKKKIQDLDERLARIPCPFCSEQILRTAKVCPHCRSDLVSTPKHPVKPMSEPPSPHGPSASGSSPFSRPPTR